MAVLEREVEIATGRRAADAHVRVAVFAEGLLTLSVEGTGERVPTLLLTVEQARKLQNALAEIVPLAARSGGGDAGAEETEIPSTAGEQWDGMERRAGAK